MKTLRKGIETQHITQCQNEIVTSVSLYMMDTFAVTGRIPV